MKIIKLDAIDSTNDFLKGLSQSQTLENMTIVTAKSQTKGRGQMGSSWQTEKNKSLITSILVKNTLSAAEGVFDLNITVAISVINALKKNKIPELSIKWPNDIMSANKKIAGILIENLIKENTKIESIIGIGLNVNQTGFENLPKASSLKTITGQDFDIDGLLFEILEELEFNLKILCEGNVDLLWKKYHDLLFKIGKPVVFENENQEKFMGIIQKVNPHGMLEILLEDDSIKAYGIKEISMIY